MFCGWRWGWERGDYSVGSECLTGHNGNYRLDSSQPWYDIYVWMILKFSDWKESRLISWFTDYNKLCLDSYWWYFLLTYLILLLGNASTSGKRNCIYTVLLWLWVQHLLKCLLEFLSVLTPSLPAKWSTGPPWAPLGLQLQVALQGL